MGKCVFRCRYGTIMKDHIKYNKKYDLVLTNRKQGFEQVNYLISKKNVVIYNKKCIFGLCPLFWHIAP